MTDRPPAEPRPPAEDGAEPNLFRAIADWLRGFTGLGGGSASLRESVEELLEEHEPAAEPSSVEERVMLLNLLRFGEVTVEDVMVPRADIAAVEVEASLDRIIAAMSDSGHSRLPVYRETLDDVIGVIDFRDLLGFWSASAPFELAAAVRKPLFVPHSMKAAALLREMRATKIQMALVVDEHGGIDGLVTIEDIIEQIVGEIEDIDDQTPILVKRDDGSFEADGRVAVEDLERLVGIDLLPQDRDEEIDTLGGLVVELIGRIPKRGELVQHPSGLDIEILDADPRRVRRLRIRRRPQSAEPTASAAAG